MMSLHLNRPKLTRRSRIQPRNCHFHRGTLIVEQVLLLALIAGGASLASDSIDFATHSTIDQINNASHQADTADKALHGPMGSIRTDADYSIDIVNAKESIYVLRILAVGSFIFLGIGIWYLLYRKAKKEVKAKATESVEIPKSDADLFSANVFAKRQEMLRALLADPSLISQNHLTIQQLMSTQLVIVKGSMSKKRIQDTMAESGMRHLLVCDAAEELIGIISNRDLSRSGSTAAKIMTPNPTTLEADSPLLPTITLLLKRCISCLPVTDKGKLVGVLTTTDLIMALQCAFQVIERSAKASSNETKSEEQIRVEASESSLAP